MGTKPERRMKRSSLARARESDGFHEGRSLVWSMMLWQLHGSTMGPALDMRYASRANCVVDGRNGVMRRSELSTPNLGYAEMRDLSRRGFIRTAGAAAVAAACAPAWSSSTGAPAMYGLIGKITAVAGQRDALIAVLLEAAAGMPGCLSYVVAKDAADEDAIWVTEVWDSRASHEASLSLPAVQQAMEKGRPLIAGFGERFETEPVGGHGLGVAED